MKNPLISVGIPTFNRAKVISETLDALINQSYRNIEIIISDDASSDETSEICRKYAKKDKRITFFSQKTNLGLPGNHNFVLNKAKGKYFVWAGDDDPRDTKFIEKLHKLFLKNKDTVLAMCNFYEFKGKYKNPIDTKYPEYLSKFQASCYYLTHPALLVWGMFKTDVLNKIGGFHTDNRPILHWGSDNVTVFKVLLHGGLSYEKDLLLYKRDSGNATSPHTTLVNLNFNKTTINRMLRYLSYPIMFFYDFIYLLYFTLLSTFSMFMKIKICICCLRWYFNININFLREISRGVISITKGILLRLGIL